MAENEHKLSTEGKLFLFLQTQPLRDSLSDQRTLFPAPCYLTISDDEVRLMPVKFSFFIFFFSAFCLFFYCILSFFFKFIFLLFNRCHRHSLVQFFLPVLIWNKLHLFRRILCNIIYIFDKQNWQQKAP